MDYWIAMTVIDAEEIKKSSKAASVHAYDKKSRKDFYSDLNKNAKLVEKDKIGDAMSTQEAAMQLANAMMGK